MNVFSIRKQQEGDNMRNNNEYIDEGTNKSYNRERDITPKSKNTVVLKGPEITK